MPSHQDGSPIATVAPAGIPGLVNVKVSTGEEFSDLTLGQLRSLAREHGWVVIPTTEQT